MQTRRSFLRSLVTGAAACIAGLAAAKLGAGEPVKTQKLSTESEAERTERLIQEYVSHRPWNTFYTPDDIAGAHNMMIGYDFGHPDETVVYEMWERGKPVKTWYSGQGSERIYLPVSMALAEPPHAWDHL